MIQKVDAYYTDEDSMLEVGWKFEVKGKNATPMAE